MTAHPAARPPARPRMVMPKLTPQQGERIRAVLAALLKRIREALTPVIRAVREAARALAEAAAHMRRHASQHRPNRPAWASPYGPAPRPHRSHR